jgi:hypothetical protein
MSGLCACIPSACACPSCTVTLTVHSREGAESPSASPDYPATTTIRNELHTAFRCNTPPPIKTKDAGQQTNLQHRAAVQDAGQQTDLHRAAVQDAGQQTDLHRAAVQDAGQQTDLHRAAVQDAGQQTDLAEKSMDIVVNTDSIESNLCDINSSSSGEDSDTEDDIVVVGVDDE